MASDSQVLRGIDWREAFPFTNIFRAFRIAIHPSKMALGLIALLLLYTGGRILDGVWSSKYRAVPGEIALYESDDGTGDLSQKIDATRTAIEKAAAMKLVAMEKYKKEDDALKAVQDSPGKAIADIKFEVRKKLDEEVGRIKKRYDAAVQPANMTGKQIDDAKLARDNDLKQVYQFARREYESAEQIRGEGLFIAFFKYQTQQANNISAGVLNGNWLGRDGVVFSTKNFFTVAPSWAIHYHWLYFLMFGTLFLIVWSLFGGAIARIAAVQAADDGRKLSLRQGLGFSVSKFLSFISAPLIPLIIIVVIGAVVSAVAGLAFILPWIGEIGVSALFFLALAAGFVITLVIIGMTGGMNLMYPTIAVEGSDSFDAISRSFSYIYARPWRTIFYSAVAIAYGALSYLFVRLFIFLMLSVTWFFVGLLIFRHADTAEPIWSAIMARPDWRSLPYEIDTLPLSWAGSMAAFFTAMWVYVTIAMLGAFAISFYFSANTIIYYLLRREVDATELDDVYLEQSEDDFGDTPAGATPALAAESVATGGTPAGS